MCGKYSVPLGFTGQESMLRGSPPFYVDPGFVSGIHIQPGEQVINDRNSWCHWQLLVTLHKSHHPCHISTRLGTFGCLLLACKICHSQMYSCLKHRKVLKTNILSFFSFVFIVGWSLNHVRSVHSMHFWHLISLANHLHHCLLHQLWFWLIIILHN